MSVPPIYTGVGHTGIHELHFKGQRVFADLLGATTLAQIIGLGIGGRVLTSDETVALDDIVTAMSSADPRLWPFKITRLAAAGGAASYGIACTLVASEGGIFGSNRLKQCAQFLTNLAEVQESGRLTDAQIRDALDTSASSFGVLYRNKDERFAALVKQTIARRRHTLPYFDLMQRVVALGRERQLEPHVFLGVAAVALDLGWSPYEVASVALLLLFHDALPNAVEGAAQRSASLQCLPTTSVHYNGPTPRKSPRAQASDDLP